MAAFLYKNDLPNNLDLGNIIAIDTEAMGLKITRDRLCLIQISGGNGHAHLVQFEKDNFNAPNLKKLLTDKNITKIFHFARFDLAILKHYLGVEIENIFCTKIASKLVRTYTDSHGLKTLCEELLGAEISKREQSSDWGNSEISSRQQKYAAGDVLHLHEIKKKLEVMLVREGRLELAQDCFKFLKTRIDLDLAGFENLDIFAH